MSFISLTEHFWFDRLGIMVWPLLACSLGAVVILIDRALAFALILRPWSPHDPAFETDDPGWRLALERFDGRCGATAEGVRLLLTLREQPRALRQEALNLWLAELRDRLLAHVHWLALIAAVAPLLGLLGTVLGLVVAFRELVASGAPVTPHLLANGLQQAMMTTVVGLAIAVPASVAAHGFREWGEANVSRLARLLAWMDLRLSGLPQDPGMSGREEQEEAA